MGLSGSRRTVVIGVAAIVVTGGAAAPLVIVAAGSTIAYGVSNGIEAAQDIQYGQAGDIESVALNPIRDTVFLGNATAYDTWGTISTGISLGFCIPGAGASAGKITMAGTKQAIQAFLGSGVKNIAQQTVTFGAKTLLVAGSGVAVEQVVVPYTSEDFGRLSGLLAGAYVGSKVFKVKPTEANGSSKTSFRDLMTPEEGTRYDAYWNDGITSIPKGSRPDPSTYLSQDYIDTHLAQFDDGVSVIQTDWAYSRYSETNGFVGVPDDNTLFVMPKNYCDDVISGANGNISVIEKELGFPDGYFSDGGGLVRIDADNISGLNIRIPSGNETGANKLWIPGGKTSGGVPEAITNTIPLKDTTVTRLEVK
jgi:hypothetical protein